MNVIAVSTSSFGRAGRRPVELLEAAGWELRLNPHGRRLERAETAELLAGARGLIAGVEVLDREILEGAPGLEVISRCGAGLDGVDLTAAAELGIEVRSTPDALTRAVAELAVGGLLALLRRIPEADREVRDGTWRRPVGRELAGSRVGIVGLGRIGRAVARRLAGFEVELLAHDPEPDREFAAEHAIELVDLDRLFTDSDVVTLHLAAGPATRHLVDRARLASMRPGAILVNCARGSLVDEAALAQALASGRIGGAFLDVFEREPYRGPLAAAPNTLLTPHIGSYAAEARLRMETEAATNLLAAIGRRAS